MKRAPLAKPHEDASDQESKVENPSAYSEAARKAARDLAQLGGSQPDLAYIPRRRPVFAHVLDDAE